MCEMSRKQCIVSNQMNYGCLTALYPTHECSCSVYSSCSWSSLSFRTKQSMRRRCWLAQLRMVSNVVIRVHRTARNVCARMHSIGNKLIIILADTKGYVVLPASSLPPIEQMSLQSPPITAQRWCCLVRILDSIVGWWQKSDQIWMGC